MRRSLIRSTVLIVLFSVTGAQVSGQSTNRQALAWYERGETEYNRGQYENAIKSLTQCILLNPTYYEAYTTRAAAKERTGDHKGAITDLSIYLDKYPFNRDVLFSRGIARYQEKQYETAIEDLHQVLQLPDTGQTNMIYYQRVEGDAGISGIVSMQSGLKDQVYYYLSLCYHEAGNTDRAMQLIDSALLFKSTKADYHSQKGLIYLKQNDQPKAELSFIRALDMDPDHAEARYNLNRLGRDLGPEEIERQLTLSIERNPDRYFTHMERAYFRQEHGNLRGALADYNRAIQLKADDVDLYINRGLVRDKLGDFEGAIRDFSKAITLDERNEKGWFCRANALSKQGRTKEAIDDYTVAITFYPSYGAAYFNRAIAWQVLGNLDEACKDVQKAEALGITDGRKLRSRVCRSHDVH